MSFWSDKIVLVTGGHGFLGTHLVRELSRKGCRSLVVPTSAEWDLSTLAVSDEFLRETKPDIVFHLAAKVGGIGINKEKPAEFFFDNLMMSVPLLHQAWKQGVSKLVSVGTVCSYPKHTPVPFVETDFWNGYPEETNAPYGLAKKMMVVAGMAYRTQYNFSSIHLLSSFRSFVSARRPGVAVRTGNGDGTFQSTVNFITGSLNSALVAGDFNNDGGTDLAVADLSGHLTILLAR